MDDKRISSPLGKQRTGCKQSSRRHEQPTKSPRKINSESKIGRVLTALANGDSFNRFQAEQQLHDHCLHSNVSSIQQKYGIQVFRKFETVRGYRGSPTKVCRYSLIPEERQKAQKVLCNG